MQCAVGATNGMILRQMYVEAKLLAFEAAHPGTLKADVLKFTASIKA
jgi:hypothetical protein